MTKPTYDDEMDHREDSYRHIGFKDNDRTQPIWACGCGLLFISEDPRVHFHRWVKALSKREAK